jgi:ElaA protein
VTTVHSARPAELSLAAAYPILKLRVDVFVVEQVCPYPELDGRDLEPDALWYWATGSGSGSGSGSGRGDTVIATLRVLTDADGAARIGRVATDAGARSSGAASDLMRAALADLGPRRAVRLDAQAYLEQWYARFGFVRCGPEFIEDGIAHVPMSRDPGGPDY